VSGGWALKRRFLLFRLVLLVSLSPCLLVSSPARAAPPTFTYLFPAGAQRGKTVEVTAGGVFPRWPVQVWVEGKGIEVKPARDKGRLTVTVADDAVPGTYWIRLFDAEGASSPRPFLVGTLPEVLEQGPKDAKKPQVLASSSLVVNGRLEKPGDVDCFALTLRRGQTLVASLLANRTLGSPMDGVLQVVSADGFVLEHNDDFHGLDPQIVFAVPKDGTYIVRTFAFPAVPDAGIQFAGGEQFIYRLTLTTGGFIDHPFPLAVARAKPGQVELVGWNIPEAARTLPIERTADLDSVTLFHPQVANTVAVRLEPHPAIVQDKANDRRHPQTLALPVTVSGCLERAEAVHVYRFEAKKGQRLSFQVEAQALGFPLSPVLVLTDAAGKSLARAEGPAPGRDPELSFQVPGDGVYQLEVSDLHGGGGPRFLYRLRATPAEPDFDLSLAADRFVLAPGKPLDIPVTVAARNGFDRPIELVVEGLPEGVTAAPLPAAAGTKAITLRLSGGAKPASVPIRIVGKSKGKEELTRTARAALAGLDASTVNVWLTVPGTAGEKK
jgi:hypothetical protein